jgi:hypothetical protein
VMRRGQQCRDKGPISSGTPVRPRAFCDAMKAFTSGMFRVRAGPVRRAERRRRRRKNRRQRYQAYGDRFPAETAATAGHKNNLGCGVLTGHDGFLSDFLERIAIMPASPMTPFMFRFSYRFQIVAGDLNGVVVQNRFTPCAHTRLPLSMREVCGMPARNMRSPYDRPRVGI